MPFEHEGGTDCETHKDVFEWSGFATPDFHTLHSCHCPQAKHPYCHFHPSGNFCDGAVKTKGEGYEDGGEGGGGGGGGRGGGGGVLQIREGDLTLGQEEGVGRRQRDGVE